MVCINYTHQNSKALPGACGGSICMCHDCMNEREEIRISSDYLNMVKWENKSIETLRAVRKAYIESHKNGDRMDHSIINEEYKPRCNCKRVEDTKYVLADEIVNTACIVRMIVRDTPWLNIISVKISDDGNRSCFYLHDTTKGFDFNYSTSGGVYSKVACLSCKTCIGYVSHNERDIYMAQDVKENILQSIIERRDMFMDRKAAEEICKGYK